MLVTVHPIKSRRAEDVQVASAADFKLGAGGSAHSEVLLSDPELSLYCLDLNQDRALFVRCPHSAELYSSRFFYQQQRKCAQEVLSVSLPVLMQLSERSAKRFSKLGFLFSVGRCGSTAVLNAIAAVPGVRTVSEPDFLSQLVTTRGVRGGVDPETARLIGVCLAFCVPASDGADTHLVVKPRGYVLQVSAELWRAFPQMRAVMLTREPEQVVASYLRMLDQRAGAWLPRNSSALRVALSLQSKSDREAMLRMMPVLHDVPLQKWTSVGVAGLVLANWASMIQKYRSARALDLPIALSGYEDLLLNSDRSIAGLTEALHMPRSASDVACARFRSTTSFTSRSQRDVPRLSSKERAELRALLRLVPLVGAGDIERA